MRHQAAMASTPPARGSDRCRLSLAEQLVRCMGASDAFVSEVRELLATAVPVAALEILLRLDYQVQVKHHLTAGRPDLHPDIDLTGGLHDWGPLGNHLMVAEFLRCRFTGDWLSSRVWRNAVVHECGHVVDRALSASSAADFRRAWEEDRAAMPAAVSGPRLPDGRDNPFHYYLRPGPDGTPTRAQQETWAESFDVLLRGEASVFNHGSFHAWFPRCLAEVRRVIEGTMG